MSAGTPLLDGIGNSRRATAEGLQKIEYLASQGRPAPEIAEALGISRDNFNRLLKTQPEARDRWEAGKNLLRRSPASLALAVPGRNGRPLAIQPAGLEAIRALAARGVSERTIAAQLSITKKQLAQALETDRAVSEAFEQGRAALEQHAIENLIKLSDEGSVAATIFLCKNVAGYSDNGPISKGTTTNVQIVLPAAQSREDFARSIVTVQSEGSG